MFPGGVLTGRFGMSFSRSEIGVAVLIQHANLRCLASGSA